MPEEQQQIIRPTIGRKVWYTPTDFDGGLNSHSSQPFDATVVHVWDDRCVNLFVLDHNGQSATRSSVRLLQPGDEVPAGGGYAQWMPYQVGQARKDSAERITGPSGEGVPAGHDPKHYAG